MRGWIVYPPLPDRDAIQKRHSMWYLNANQPRSGELEQQAIPAERVERTAQAIRGAELKTLPGVGHFPMVEFDGFANLVADFLIRHGL